METYDIDVELRGAEDLVAQGQMLQAVDRLEAAHREHPDHRVACRLVELRHAAFRELARGQGRPDWPARHPDPFPRLEGIPTVAPADLSSATLGGAITHHGCLRVDGLVDANTAERLRDRIERAFDARERIADGASVESAAPWFVPYAPGRRKANVFGRDHFIRVVDAPDALCDLVEVFTATASAEPWRSTWENGPR